jgi:WD40 repeat protein
MYTGDGGNNIRLAILAPDIQGDVPGYLPIYIQGLLNNNIGKFSAISLIDRQNLNKIITEQNLSASGRFSDTDFINIGNLTNAQYFLFGTIQKLSENRYSLQLAITEASTGVRTANFMKDGNLSQFEGRGMLLNEATAQLLEQIGIQLTDSGKQELLTGNTSTVLAQTGLARGITAQAGGSEIEALFNFTQAITFDPSQLEALSRLNTLSTTISSGTISQKILNDLQARDRWIDAFKETTRFFNEHPPFEITFDPNLIQIGETNYARRTANLGMRIALDPSVAGFGALNALLEGLEKTGRRNTWGFSGWPLMDIIPRTKSTVVFNGKRSFEFVVNVALINQNNKTVGSSSISLKTKKIIFSSGDTRIILPDGIEGIMKFSNLKVEELTPILNIAIMSVNGIPAQNLSASGYMRIETGDLEKKEVFPQLGHTSYVNSVAFSPDGRQILSGSGDNSIKLWDVAAGWEIKTFSGHTGFVYSVAFSPDGRQILSGSWDGTFRKWDINTLKEIAKFIGFNDGEWVVITPDGYYNTSPNGDKHINVRIDFNVYPIDQYREIYNKPKIVEARLQGRKE